MRVGRRWSILWLAAAVLSCGRADEPTTPDDGTPSRTYFMGFSPFPPRPDTSLVPRTVDLWAQRADAGLVLIDPPWEALLAGVDPETAVRSNPVGQADFFRSKGLRVVASIDPTNGLDRARDSDALLAAGRSISDPAVQQLYARYVGAFAALVRPEYLGVASETNLVRAIAPSDLYAGLVAAANTAAAAARAASPAARLFTTVQVETAWGRLGSAGSFVGVARERADFPFTEVLGLSSYPYLAGFAEPEDLPLDYYTRLLQSAPLPVMVIEGGWTSVSLGSITSSPDKQRRYVERHAQLLDAARALGVFQITFTDLDLSGFPPGPASLPLFAHLGLVDVNLTPKPALSSWDVIYRRPWRP
jgi:hypothetical protein